MSAGPTLKILTVVGARPNFMKAAPIIWAIREYDSSAEGPGIRHMLVHTGQHYDAIMSDSFFSDLGLDKPDVHLGVGSGSPAGQTAEILRKFEEVVLKECPDIVIVVGDVNSTVACALAVAKTPVCSGRRRPLIAHVEAGLRSFDRTMPEEINRIITDHLADLLFVTEKSGLINLRREGIPGDKVFFVGNTMIDSLLAFKDRADESRILDQLGLRTCVVESDRHNSIKAYALLTLHRPSNVDETEPFCNILEGLSELSKQIPIIFPIHPRTRKRVEDFGLQPYFQGITNANKSGIRVIDPLGYIDFICMMKNARLVLTDSGGVQEETTCLGVPCVTIRENTERPVTITYGTNIVAGTAVDGIRKAIVHQTSRNLRMCIPEKWDGKTAQRILPILVEKWRNVIARTPEQHEDIHEVLPLTQGFN